MVAPGLARASGSGVQFTQPAAGAALRRSATVAVTADPSATSVLFEWSEDGGTTYQPIGVDGDGTDGWSEPWDTTAANDGPVTLRATEAGPFAPVSGTEDVTVDNT